MYSVYVVKDYKDRVLTISSINGINIIVNDQKADLLAAYLVNIFELKDLGINLADKKIYHLIDKVNNT